MAEYLSKTQLDQLLKPLNPSRVEILEKAGQSLSYLNQADVRAHLTRIFGFCRWDSEVLETQLLFEQEVEGKDRKGEPVSRWYVGWRATVQLSLRAPDGSWLCTYTETAIGGNVQPQRHEASDMALKSAVSDALKRCAINLGDQFGLGLYSKGSTGAYVRAVLWPEPDTETPDLLSEAWTIIANANGGQWEQVDPGWRVAAERWQDRYHQLLDKQNVSEVDETLPEPEVANPDEHNENLVHSLGMNAER